MSVDVFLLCPLCSEPDFGELECQRWIKCATSDKRGLTLLGGAVILVAYRVHGPRWEVYRLSCGAEEGKREQKYDDLGSSVSGPP